MLDAILEKKLQYQFKFNKEFGVPEEFQMYLTYCRNLKFVETPDYEYLRQLFKNLMIKLKYKLDF